MPGAEWSLLKEGEKLQVIGKARDTGWYRCMALREYKVRLDLAPFSFMRQSMLNSSTSGNSKRQSGITPEMIEEEYSDRKSLSIDPLTEVRTYMYIEVHVMSPHRGHMSYVMSSHEVIGHVSS